MADGRYFWTTDRVVGAFIAGAGAVAFLVKLNLLDLKLNFHVPALVAAAWPCALIGAGVVLLWSHRRRTSSDRLRIHGGKNGDRT